MTDNLFGRFRANFLTGLAVVLPALISIAVLLWLFGTVSGFTDQLLFFLPRRWTHADGGTGKVYWYWSMVALILAITVITVIGRSTRHYLGKKIIEWTDYALLRVPLLNKVYGVVKQVNEALSSKKSSFKQVVMIPFPHSTVYSLGFLTNEQPLPFKEEEKLITVFVPTTPNPTSGFLVLVPAKDVTKVDIPVSEGIRFIISIGSIPPDQRVPFAQNPEKPVQM
jgi:uncharacterized membrane protein